MARHVVSWCILGLIAVLGTASLVTPEDVTLHFALVPFKYVNAFLAFASIPRTARVLCSTLMGEHAVWNILSHAFLETNIISVRPIHAVLHGLVLTL